MKRFWGFSLIEVNMAVFVMAFGVIALAALYPLGLRESVQSSDDLNESMFADMLLNAAVSAAGSTNVLWTDWQRVRTPVEIRDLTSSSEARMRTSSTVPTLIKTAVTTALNEHNNNRGSDSPRMELGQNCEMYVFRVSRYGAEQRDNGSPLMGFIVTSLMQDLSQYSTYRRNLMLSKQQLYYAEALFHGQY